MKIELAFLLALAGITWLAPPTLAQEGGPTVLAKGLFSYQAPPGWTLITSPYCKFPVSLGAKSDGLNPIIYVAVRPFPGTLSDCTAALLTILRAEFNRTIVNQQPFATSAGLEGVRIVMRQPTHKVNVQSVYYLFDGGGGNKLMIVAGCAASDASRDTPLFDASVKTFSLE